MKLKGNKKGVSLTELIAAIVIIGLASTTITTAIITSYRSQLRATQYNLAKQVAKNYDSMLIRDIKYNNLVTLGDNYFKPAADSTDKYVTLTGTMIDAMTKDAEGNKSAIYNYLFDDNFSMELNGQTYDKNNVTIRIHMLSVKMGYFRTEVTVRYNNNTRTVTYNGAHSKD